MARGLFKNWSQSVYYNFDMVMSRDILFAVIQLYDNYYITVTYDMDPINMKLWKEL